MTEGDTGTFETRVLAADDEGLAEALALLRAGQVVVFPTDTVYGVGCDLWQPEAVARLYEAKRRPRHMAIPILVSDVEHVARVARDVPARMLALAERFWPGGLTVILPRRPEVPDIVCAGGDTIAVRMPDDAHARRLIAHMGGALAATSANLSSHAAKRCPTWWCPTRSSGLGSSRRRMLAHS
jgi:L-threonylcarbamoyladenylate synthase